MSALPRQTYRTDADAQAENEIAEFVASAWRCQQLKVGIDHPDRMKSKVDRALHDGTTIKCFFEAKGYRYRFRGDYVFGVTRSKIVALRDLSTITALPVLFVARFSCGTVAYFDVTIPFEPGTISRSDRGDAADSSPAARYAWDAFKIVRERRT